MRLYLIRHGQSFNNALWTENQSEKGRVYDPPLTEIGYKQAECAAQFLREGLATRLPFQGRYQDAERPSLLYTSLMSRAVATGSAIARALEVPLVALAEAHEEGGLYLVDEMTGAEVGMEGPNRAHFEAHYPELQLPREFGERGWWGQRPREPFEGRTERAARVWHELVAKHGEGDQVIGLITHGGFYNRLLAGLLHMQGQQEVWFTLNNCAITRLDVQKEWMSLVYLNRIDFLPPELVTL